MSKTASHILVITFVICFFSAVRPLFSQSILEESRKNYLTEQTMLVKGESMQTLANNLKELTSNETELTWVIFVWVSKSIKYDVDIFFNNKEQTRPSSLLLISRSTVCDGYAWMFHQLAKLTGLTVVTVTGHSKGYGFSNETAFIRQYTHAWNAVKINGEWKLIDTTWGSGYLNPKKQFISYFNDYYFFTPPEQFILDHFPEDSKWQLLETPYSTQDYVNGPQFKPVYFTYNIEGEVNTYELTAENRLTLEYKTAREIQLMAQLEANGKPFDQNYTFQNKRSNDRTEILVRFPKSGVYQVQLFAHSANEDDEYYKWAASYKVNVEVLSESNTKFPTYYDGFISKNGHLRSPLYQQLTHNQPYHFELTLDHNSDVYIIDGDHWQKMSSLGNVFESRYTPVNSKKLAIVIGDSNRSDRYSVILEYDVVF